MKRVCLVIVSLFVGMASMFAQYSEEQRDSIRLEQYKQEIGIDMTVPDFEITKLDSVLMGTRLYNIITFLLDNYPQGLYNQKKAQITSEQVPALEKEYIDIKKISFAKASKQGNHIDVVFKVEPYKNKAKVKKADLHFCFTDGVTESETTNMFFSYMSRYVQARETLNKTEDK